MLAKNRVRIFLIFYERINSLRAESESANLKKTKNKKKRFDFFMALKNCEENQMMKKNDADDYDEDLIYLQDCCQLYYILLNGAYGFFW